MNSKTARVLYTTGAILSGLCSVLFLISTSVFSFACDKLINFADILTGNAIPEHNSWFDPLIMLIAYAAPAALCSGLAWNIPENRKNALRTSVAYVSIPLLTAVVMLILNGLFGLLALLATALGAFGCIGCILLYKWLQKKLPSVFNRETISYIVFGVLTTVVSFVSQMLFSAAGLPVIVNTIGSWVCAVLFAYVVNKLFVFESKTDTAKAFWWELGLFIGARVASLGMELVFMFVTVELLNFSEAVCKLIAQVFILVANYVFSKLVIFKK